MAGQRILLPRAKEARLVLPDGLRAAGADVTEVVAYETVPEEPTAEHARAEKALLDGTADAVTFTSGSTAKHFAARLGAEKLKAVVASPRLKCVAIGPITSQMMRECGIPVAAEAARHDIPGLVERLCGCLKK